MDAANYEIRIRGRVSDSLLPAFEGLAVTTEPVETIVYGLIADQEAVHKLLIKLQSPIRKANKTTRNPKKIAPTTHLKISVCPQESNPMKVI